jgi:hypothetical protein
MNIYEATLAICHLCNTAIPLGPCAVVMEASIVPDGRIPEGTIGEFSFRSVHADCLNGS